MDIFSFVTGIPPPSVVWFKDTHLLDSQMESLTQFPTEPGPAVSSNAIFNTTYPVRLTTPSSRSSNIAPTMGPGPPRLVAGEPFNTLTLGPLTRNDLKLLLTCEASNNNLTLPTSLVVMVDMNRESH